MSKKEFWQWFPGFCRSGKGYAEMKALLEAVSGTVSLFSISATTRKPREGEEHGESSFIDCGGISEHDCRGFSD